MQEYSRRFAREYPQELQQEPGLTESTVNMRLPLAVFWVFTKMKNLLLTLHPGKGWALFGHWKEHQHCCHSADNQSHTCRNNPPIYQPSTLVHVLDLLHHLFKNNNHIQSTDDNSPSYWLLFKMIHTKLSIWYNHSWHLQTPSQLQNSVVQSKWDKGIKCCLLKYTSSLLFLTLRGSKT